MVNVEDAADLNAYLQRQKLVRPGEQLSLRTLSGGVSNRTVLVEREDGESWVIKQALPKLRVEVDWFCDPSRVQAEAQGLRWLAECLPAGSVPGLVFEDPQQHLLAMQAIAQPHVNWKQELLCGRIAPGLVEQFGGMLATIHGRSYAERDELSVRFADRSFFEALRLEPYYGYAAENVPAARNFLRQLIVDTRLRRIALVHGDYSPKNILIYRQRVVLLDHEVMHWGDPAFDVGFALTHFLSKAHFVDTHRQNFTAAAKQFWSTYWQAIDAGVRQQELETFAIRHTLACLLARVAGRSPLEYLDSTQRHRQQVVAADLLRTTPASIPQLVTTFVERLATR